MVKLTFKTLQQKSFVIEAAETETIAQLKAKIKDSESFPVEHQKLILKGKILTDDVVVGSIGVGEKDFIVVMVTKPKAAPSVATPSAPSSATTQVAPQTATTAVPSPTTATAPASSEPIPAAFTESTLATGSQYEVAVGNLVDMGFPRDQVVAAMRAAFNNPDRAADYLMTGIPDSAREPAPAAAAASPVAQTGAVQPSATTPASATPAAGQYVNLFQQAAALSQGGGAAAAPTPAAGGASGTDLEFLRNSPQFNNLRQMVQAQPHLLPALLQQIGQTNPQLLQMITQNQDQFLSMLTGGEGGLEAGGGEEQFSITISPEENEAVNRLVALGFERNLALEAYLACDKNEELAANYLFEMGGNDF